MIGRGAAALADEWQVRVTFRRARPHERLPLPLGLKLVIAVAHTPVGFEEQPWLVPCREAKRALNPRCGGASHELASGFIPKGWQRV